MCGIVGYVGNKDTSSVLLIALERLEYRGYDSCGIATLQDGMLGIRKTTGRLTRLKEILASHPLAGTVGIGHTRWATHGMVTVENAHPFTDCKNEIAVVHNGIIENYAAIREKLKKAGHVFASQTDTEVIVHLIEEHYDRSLSEAMRAAARELVGSYAVVAISRREPGRIVGMRFGSPLVVGLGRNENIIASDILALLGIGRRVITLEDGERVVIEQHAVRVYDAAGHEKRHVATPIDLKPRAVSRGRYPHYMRKEIFDQPQVIAENVALRFPNRSLITESDFRFYPEELRSITRIFIEACGTSYHAGLAGRFLIERFARVPTDVEIASEFQARATLLDGEPLVVGISQSGETADTLAALRAAKARALRILSIVNVRRSSMDREADSVLHTHAGPEIGVASTKAYTAQILALLFFAVYLARQKGLLADRELVALVREIRQLPTQMSQVLRLDHRLREVARRFHRAQHFIFLGRGINYPSALEGALKLKEISYINATGYPAGEMKHGPISLIDKNMPVVCIAPRDSVYNKMTANIAEVKSRQGKVIALGTAGDDELPELADEFIAIPHTPEYLSPLVAALPLQLLAYHIATLRGCDVDKPRNLAKSVTVE